MALKSKSRSFSQRQKLSYAMERLTRNDIGFNREQALGALGSIAGESGTGFNTRAYNPKDPNGGSYGIGQWHSERRTALENFAKNSKYGLNDFRTQMDFVAQELKTTHNHVREAMLGATTRHKATDIWTKKYEVPAKAYEKLAKRRAHADAFAEMVATGPKSPQEAVDAAGGALANATAYAGANESLTGASMPGSEATAYSATPTPNPKKGPFESLLGGVSNAIGTAISTVDGVVDKADAAIDGDLGATSATPAKANTGFMGDTTPGAMVGALAGGYFAGPMGSIVGGLIGQGINKALTGVADQANQNGAQDVGSGIAGGVGRMIDGFFGGLSNAFGGAPENLMNETAKERREQSDRAGLNARGREVRSESKQFDRAVRSGKGGLW